MSSPREETRSNSKTRLVVRLGAAALAALLSQAIPVALVAAPVFAAKDPSSPSFTYTAAAWPSSWNAYTFANGSTVADPEGEPGISPNNVDISSDGGTQPSVYFAYDGTNAFFRLRVLGNPSDSNKGGFDNAFWLVQLATSDNVVHAVVGLNGKPVDTDYVYVSSGDGSNVTTIYQTPFDPAANQQGARYSTDGSGQYFVDFQVPMAALYAASGNTVDAATPVHLVFGSSQAANLATINKDSLVNSSDFSTLGITPLRGPSNTTTTVACTPSGSVAYGATKTCTVTVTDTAATSPTQPAGNVALTASKGSLSAASCTLVGATASTSTCAVTFTGTAVGAGSVNASYPGDGGHTSSLGSTGVTVTTAALSVAVNNASRPYGQSNPAFGVGYSGFANGDTAAALGGALSFSTSATSSSPAGDYAVTASGLTSSNYAISYVPGTLTVGTVNLTITANNAHGYFGDTPSGFTASYAGFVNGDGAGNLTGTLSCSTTATSSSPVGTYAINCSGLTSTSYAISWSAGTYSVLPATPVITSGTPPTLTYGDNLPNDPTGGDSANVPGTFSYSPTPGTGLGVGSHTVHVTFTPTDTTDYNAVEYDVTVNVNPAPLTVTANDANRAFGASDPSFDAKFEGFVGSDDSSVLDGTLSCTSTATAASPVGNYPISCSGLSSDLYDVQYVDGTLSVGKGTPAITSGTPPTLTYGDGLPDDPTGGDSANVSGAFSFDTDPGTVLHVGSHTVHVTFTPTDATDYNTVEYDVTVNVTPAPLTVTAQDAQRNEGDVDPTFTVKYDTFVNGDDESSLTGTLSCVTDAASDSTAGNYDIQCSGLSSDDYDVKFVDGTLAVEAVDNGDGNQPPGDTTNPAASAPHVAFITGSTITANRLVPLRTTWTASDDSGLAQTFLQTAVGNKSYVQVADVSCPTGTSYDAQYDSKVSARKQLREQTQAQDSSSNTSGWQGGTPFWVNDYQINSRVLRYTDKWRAVYTANYWRGGEKGTTRANASVSLTANGSAFAFVTSVGPTMGEVEITLDGESMGVVDLYAPVTTDRYVAWSTSFADFGSHTLTVTALGTKNSLSTSTRIVLDAFAVIGNAPVKPAVGGTH